MNILFKQATVLGLTAVLTVIAAPVMAQDDADVQALQQRVDRMERLLESEALMDMMRELERLTRQVRELRGETEVLANEIESLQRRQRDLYQDVDRRIRSLETAGRNGAAPRADADGDAPSPDIGVAAAQDEARQAVETPTEEQQEQELAAAAPGLGEQQAYRDAFERMREQDYDAAREGFRAFLDEHGDSGLAANAQYWLGELEYVTREFDPAMDEFRKVVEDYPDSNKVADALLKMGFIHYERQEWDEARETLERVTENYPDSTASRLAGNRLRRMAEEGR